jgi:MHS family shikimate/dehydroshikimate transporter-like MFS transporter
MGLRVAENGGSYLILSFSLVYGVHVGVDRGMLLIGVMLSMLFSFGMTLFFGHLSDKFGRRKIYAFGATALAVMAFPFFALIDSNTPGLIVLAYFIGNGVCHAAMIGTQPAFFHELFSAEVRYSGMAISHELAAVFAGGLAPLIATGLLITFDSSVPVSLYAILLALITLVALAFSGKVGDLKPQPEKTDVVHESRV